MLLTIMFQDHNISIESGEIVSDATSRAAANDRSTSDFGRRMFMILAAVVAINTTVLNLRDKALRRDS